MKESIIQIITAAVGTLGFCIYFRVREKNVPAAVIAGIISWSIYLLIFKYSNNLFLSNFIASLVVYIYAEILARVLKAPSNIFLIPGIIPLLPGGPLYYTMRAVVDNDRNSLSIQGIKTVSTTVGIAAGIVFGTVIFYYVLNLFTKNKSGK